MEALAVAGLLGLGYAITKLSTPTATEGVAAPISVKKKEPFQNKLASGPGRGAQQSLDMMYAPGYPSEVNPGPQGTAFSYGRLNPTAPSKDSMQDYGSAPQPQPIDTATAQVKMNVAGVEANAVYTDGDFVTSPLTGQKVSTKEFTHNNMTPFFGGQVRQNVGAQANTGILDSYTGAGATTIAKREVETMFDTANKPYGNPFGLEFIGDGPSGALGGKAKLFLDPLRIDFDDHAVGGKRQLFAFLVPDRQIVEYFIDVLAFSGVRRNLDSPSCRMLQQFEVAVFRQVLSQDIIKIGVQLP